LARFDFAVVLAFDTRVNLLLDALFPFDLEAFSFASLVAFFFCNSARESRGNLFDCGML
jgi:hypothetical protein